jgi:hypothetical protein
MVAPLRDKKSLRYATVDLIFSFIGLDPDGPPARRAYGSERIMQCWINGPATGGNDDKIKMANILLKTNIPAFHHSIIPFSEQIRKPQNTSIFSVGCRNSETYIYAILSI